MHKNAFKGAFLALAVAIFGWGCQGKDKMTSPEKNNQTLPGQASPDFSAYLQIEIESEEEALRPFETGNALARHTVTEITGPTVITSPGIYRVTRDFSASGDAIVIQSDHVLLDLGRHTITGPGNKVGRGVVLDGVEWVLVHGGSLRTFGIGVALLGSSRSAVKNVTVLGGDEFANPPSVPPQIGILLVNSYRNHIRRNTFDQTNLGIFVRGGGSFENRIRRNEVLGGTNGLLAICYNPAMGEGPAGPNNDDVSHNFLCRFGVGIQASAGSAENRFNSNVIKYFVSAWEDFNGTNQFRNNRTQLISQDQACRQDGDDDGEDD